MEAGEIKNLGNGLWRTGKIKGDLTGDECLFGVSGEEGRREHL